MEAARDQQMRIVNEGLRLALACKAPRLRSSAESEQLLREWVDSLIRTIPPLLDWTEQHRHTLFDEDWGPATREFQQCFALVYLEQALDRRDNFEFQLAIRNPDGNELYRRLVHFEEDIVRILNANKDLQTNLFHYHQSALELQRWDFRPVEAHSFYQFIYLLRANRVDMDFPFGQMIMLFAVQLGKVWLASKGNFEHQKQGLKLLSIVMDMDDSEPSYAEDSEEILKMALPLNRLAAAAGYDDLLWDVVYNSLRMILDVDPSLNDEVMRNLLGLFSEIIQKDSKATFGFSMSTCGYLRALNLLLLLDVEVNIYVIDEITIYGSECDWDEFLRYSRNHLQRVGEAGNLRFSIDWRIRIGQLIPRIFSGPSIINFFLFEVDPKCLEMLTWMVLFPIGQTEQQQLARGFMLKCLLDKMKRMCENIGKDRFHYVLSRDDLKELYDKLRSFLRVVIQGIDQLPDERRFRKLKWNLKRRMGITHVEMKRMANLVIQDEDDEL